MIYDFSDGHPEHRYGIKPAIAAQDMHNDLICILSTDARNRVPA